MRVYIRVAHGGFHARLLEPCTPHTPSSPTVRPSTVAHLPPPPPSAGVAELVAHALESVGASVDDVELVVQNNHHYRIEPYEQRLPFNKGVGYTPADHLNSLNLLPDCRKLELSHHLAHCWSAAATAPWHDTATPSPSESTLVMVMDGMGDQYSNMVRATETDDPTYRFDLDGG